MSFDEIYEDSEKLFNEILNNSSIPKNVKFKLIANNKMKKAYDVKKTSPMYEYLTGFNVIVVINEDLFDMLDDKLRVIIIEEILAHVYYDMDKDKLFIIQPDINTFSGILQKYDVSEYMRIKEVIATYLQG